MVGLAVGVFVAGTSVLVGEGVSVTATGYAQAGRIGRMVGAGEGVGRTGEGVVDRSGIVAVAVSAV